MCQICSYGALVAQYEEAYAFVPELRVGGFDFVWSTSATVEMTDPPSVSSMSPADCSTSRPRDWLLSPFDTATQRATGSSPLSIPRSSRRGNPSQSPGTRQAYAPVATAVRIHAWTSAPFRSSAR